MKNTKTKRNEKPEEKKKFSKVTIKRPRALILQRNLTLYFIKTILNFPFPFYLLLISESILFYYHRS